MENELSLFDDELKKENIIARSNKRRSAMIIPKEKGIEISEKIKK